MARGSAIGVLRDIDALYRVGAVGHSTDGQLLEQFLEGRPATSEAAFAALVHRHGPMVHGVCRSVLKHSQDTEDAFQATFLVLARKAASIRAQEMLGYWLYGVARRVAVRAKRNARRRRDHEQLTAGMEAFREPVDVRRRDAYATLHEEIDRLPAEYRAPVVLCYLEGNTYQAAAQSLRVSESTVRGRLARARARLHHRLSIRGIALAASVVAFSSSEASAAVPVAWMGATILASTRVPSSTPSSPADVLAKGVISAMFLTRLKVIAVVFAAAIVPVVGVSVCAQQSIPHTRERPVDGTATEAALRLGAVAVGEGGNANADEGLAALAPGRIVGRVEIVKDCMILSYLPQWSHGEVDNLGVANNGGGVRTLLSWGDVDRWKVLPEARFVIALYAREATSSRPVGPIHAFALRSDWPERTSWTTLPEYDPEPAGTFKFVPGEGWKLFDVSTIVRAGAKPTGVMLRFLSEDRSSEKRNWSGYQFVSREASGEWETRRPQLLVVEPGRR